MKEGVIIYDDLFGIQGELARISPKLQVMTVTPGDRGDSRGLTEALRKDKSCRAVVICTATGVSKPALKISSDDWQRGMWNLLVGPAFMCQAAGHELLDRGSGSIVLVTSVFALDGARHRALQCAAAAGLVGFTRSAAIEWGRRGVRINVVANVPIGCLSSAELAAAKDRSPILSVNTGADTAGAICHLLSDQGRNITGQVCAVDGGLTTGFLTRWGGADLASKGLAEMGVYDPRNKNLKRNEAR